MMTENLLRQHNLLMEISKTPATRKSAEVATRQPLQASVKNCLSLLHSQRLSQSTEDISPRALALRNEHRPSEISLIYGIDLQKELIQCRDLSILNSVKETPTLCMLEQAWGMEYVSRVLIKAHLLGVSDFVGVKTKMEDRQIDDLSDQIAMEYGDLNVLEFICFCSRLRSGKYETFYGNIDPMQIMKSLESFYEDRRRDINSAWAAAEKEKREREYEEWKKSAISFDEWYNRLSDEEKENAAFLKSIFDRDKDDSNGKKRGIIQTVKETLLGGKS